MSNPEVATRSCDDCKLWLYDPDGKRTDKGYGDIPRHPSIPTPCNSCVKKSPKEAKQFELSYRNQLALRFYSRSKAINFHNLSGRWANDGWIQKNFMIIEGILKAHEQEELAESIGQKTRQGKNG